jgi:ABC-type lipopolysaccharide export system ATPase subunit
LFIRLFVTITQDLIRKITPNKMILRAENLVKNKGRSVVKGISVEVNQGEIVGLWDQMAPKTTSFI